MTKDIILMVDEDKEYSNKFLDQLNHELEVLNKKGKPLNIEFYTCMTWLEALKNLRENPFISLILLDYELLKPGTQNKQDMWKEELIKEMRKIKPNIPVFYLTQYKYNKIFGNSDRQSLANGYFYKNEIGIEITIERFFDILCEYIKEYKKSFKTPFYNELKSYVEKGPLSWHTPGHAGGTGFVKSPFLGKDFFDFFGERVFRADLSVSVPELDSLLEPSGVIKEAQEKAARAFGAKKTLFVTNGTSTANKIILQTLIKPGEKILMDRNCHKSVHHAVIITGAKPVYLCPSINKKYGFTGPVPLKLIKEQIDKNPDAKVLIITNCTYDGLIYNTPEIVSYAHKNGIKVMIDEAWFGYAHFYSPDEGFRIELKEGGRKEDLQYFPNLKEMAAMDAGADFATQSTHKVLSAFSQASMIHLNYEKDEAPEDFLSFLQENFMVHTSTSPQYTMIASLDVARAQMEMDGYRLIHKCLEESLEIREAINKSHIFHALSLENILENFTPPLKEDGILLDPLKITIATKQISAKYVANILREKGIQVEKTTHNTFLLLYTFGITYTQAGTTLLKLLAEFKDKNHPSPSEINFPSNLIPNMAKTPREAFFSGVENSEWVPLNECKNRIAAYMIVPYPPGIPLIVPGEIISDEFQEYLIQLVEMNKTLPKISTIEIHGLKEVNGKVCCRVLKKD